MSIVNDTNKDHVLSYEGLEDVVAKIKNTFVRNTKQASEVELGLIKALENTEVQLDELQGHDSDGNNYPVQIISDGTAFVNMPKPEVDEKVKNEVITDNTVPYFLLGQPSQNTVSQAYINSSCYIMDNTVYSRGGAVLSYANLEDDEILDRDPNTWQYIKLDADGFMGVDVATVPNPDWNTNDVEDKSFIKNRTHYEDELTISAAGTYNVPIGSIYSHTLSAVNGNMNGLATPITLEVGVRTQINSGPPVWVTLSEDGILLIEEGGTGYVNAYNIKYSYIVQLDEKYIPDTIARSENVTQADWNEHFPSSPSYINGRTHWIEYSYNAISSPGQYNLDDYGATYPVVINFYNNVYEVHEGENQLSYGPPLLVNLSGNILTVDESSYVNEDYKIKIAVHVQKIDKIYLNIITSDMLDEVWEDVIGHNDAILDEGPLNTRKLG